MMNTTNHLIIAIVCSLLLAPLGAYAGEEMSREPGPGEKIESTKIGDAKTKQLLWRSAATGALANQPDPASAAEKIDGIVQQMFQNYPPKPGK